MKMRISIVVAFFAIFIAVSCTPAKLYFGNGMTVRSQRQQGMVFTGFFGPSNNPQGDGYKFETSVKPQDQNPSNDQALPNVDTTEMKLDEENPQTPQENENTDMNKPDEAPEEEEEDEESDEEDEDDDDYSWPFFTFRRRSQKPFVNFFPVIFGGYGRSGNPSGSIAIANSFSTGTKGVAASSATAFGETAPSRYGRPRPSKTQHKIEVQTNKPDAPKADNQDTVLPITETITNVDTTTLPNDLMDITTELETSTKLEETTPPQQEIKKQESEEDTISISKTEEQQPSINYFPITFEGSGNSEDPASTVAIANSLSMGKGSKAMSDSKASENAKYRQQGMIFLGRYKQQNNKQDSTILNNEAQFVPHTEYGLPKEENVEGTTKINDLPQKVTTEVNEAPDSTQDSEEDKSLLPKRRDQQPSINFFPISFGGSGKSASPLGNVAIANSYSTGKGGIAMSDAKAFADKASYTQKEMVLTRYNSQNNNDEPIHHTEAASEENYTPIEVTSQKPEETTSDVIETSTKVEKTAEQTIKEGEEDEVLTPKIGQQPTYNYFPITFGSQGRSGNLGHVAIANSFNTGKKGVAMSNAEASARYTNRGYLGQQINEEEVPQNVVPNDNAPNTEGTTQIIENQETTTEVIDIITKKDGLIKKELNSEEEDPTYTTKEALQPSYNYFPISFGSGRSAGNPGTVAIANSYSTGKGGVAMSKSMAGASPSGFEKARYEKEITTQESELDQEGTTEISTEENDITTETNDSMDTTTEYLETTTVLDVNADTKKQIPKTKTAISGFGSRRRQQPIYNFFPVSFGGYGRSGDMPYGTVAIANSYSTGKGGVASSSATSFGEAISSRKRGNARYIQYY